ncbi:phage tail protein [Escherichia coli]|uniref:phage tail protein n=2 Tax=Escherichia coli TaxID=562 RepID=UPI0003BB3170|nr:phage tail protein [Escherichia coli]EGC5561319.1 phage tail protein [Escherichia coli]EGF4700594.1 phage tail protein [Escherichia coli]EHH8592687.1 phage tail protein [Escherichia coli]EHZ4655400.1 phage tail protein [Escherichia coli]EID6762878.1 phage tail protein [Escherichia coli]
MSTKFYTLLTDIGAAKLASAAALGVPLKITHMAVGDGGGALPTPDAKQTALVNEKRRAALNMLYIDPQNSSQIIAEQVIPENEGGWWIREVGLFDESGALIAVGNCPESYKPQLAEGSGRTQTVRMVLITSSTDNITLKIDPAVVLATRKYVDDKVLELKVFVDDKMAKHLAAPDPHSQYAPKESPTLTGTPKAPTPAEGNNTTQIATTAFVQAAITALINGAPATLDTLKEIAAAINNDPKFSTTINNALALKAPLSSPALTGTPTAPTAAQSVNNTQIATTAFVKSAIAAMVGSAPAALDTLNELAAALGNDPNFATTMLNALAGKQPLDNTLTNLSGKDVAGLLTYLGLGEARFSGRLLNTNIFKSSGKYIPTPGTKKIRVIASGGGGGGGGVPETTENQQATAGAGLSGAFIEAFFEVDNDFEVNVIIGAAGKGGGAGRNSGSEGGTTYFGSLITAPGGTGGGAGGASANTSYIQGISWGASPTSSGTVLRAFRCSAKTPGAMVISVKAVAGGTGGDTPLGSGGIGGASSSSFSGRGGGKAEGFGAGGGGACASAGSEAQSGGDGAPGIVIVEEYA